MKVIKTLFTGIILIACLSLVSCKSTKKVPAAEAGAEENGDSTGSKAPSKNYTGWIDIPVKNLDLKVGSVRIRTKTKLGSYNISYLTEDGKYVPILSPANEYTGSYYSLKVGKKVYKLTPDVNIKTKARLDDSQKGLAMYYNVKDVASLVVQYDILSSSKKVEADMVKVTATIINESSKKQDFALKTILDTILGESNQYHFYTSEKAPVKNETLYRDVKNEKWIMSKNGIIKMQILLNGADISPIESVALANYVTLDTNLWEPDMLSYRAFDTVLSYNNSAVGITWPSVVLENGQSKSFIFYMAFAADVSEPKGFEYITQNSSEEQLAAFDSEDDEVEVVNTPAEKQEEKITVAQNEKTSVIQNTSDDVAQIIPSVGFDVSKISKEQLSPEYVQNLINKINMLEEDDSTVNRETLLQLNAELDAILEVLRQ